MKNYKAFVSLFLALAIPLLMLAGCVESSDNPDITPPVDTGTATVNETPEAPNYDISSFRDAIDDNGFFRGVKAAGCIEMFNYKGMDIPSDVHQVSDDEVQDQVEYLVSQYADPAEFVEQITDRAVADGDQVNIDYIGSVDGVEFDGGSTDGAGTTVTAGSMDYIDDFQVQIIGHMPGETMDVNVTFPDEYPNNPDLAGKPALFVTTINYIEKSDMSKVLTDAFVQDNLSDYYGWTSVAEMKTSMKSDIRKFNIQQYIKDYFVNNVTILDMPAQLLDYQENSMINYYQEYASYYGVEMEELLSSEGISSVDELISTYYDSNYQSAVSLLVIIAIAEDAGFTVSDNDIVKYFNDNNMDYESQYDSIVEQYGLPFIKHNVLCQKVIDYIVDNANLL